MTTAQGTGKRGRPVGMYKRDGLWYYADGTISPASAAKMGINDTPSVPPTLPAIVSQKPAQLVTEDTVIIHRNYGTRIHNQDEIKAIEVQTGLMCAGFYADDFGCQIPIFLRNDHSEDEIAERLLKVRRGI